MNLSVNFETYINYYSIAFSNGYVYEVWNDKVVRGNLDEVVRLLHSQEIYTYNGRDYDRYVIDYALGRQSCQDVKRYSDAIIEKEIRFPKLVNTRAVKYIDLIHSMPAESDSGFKGGSSLAFCAARRKAVVIVGLDLYLKQEIADEKQCKMVRDYNILNCLHTTSLVEVAQEVLDIKRYLSVEYKRDFMSSTMPEIAESVVRHKVGYFDKWDGVDVEVNYVKPDSVVIDIPIAPFVFTAEKKNKGAVYPCITIAGKPYQMGSGGLHSKESSQTVLDTDTHELAEFDAASYYPAIIIGYRPEFPLGGTKVIDILEEWRTTRLEAKRNKDTLRDKAYKLLILSIFGKMGSPYSVMFSPKGFRFVTITGQMMLLDIITAFEDAGISVVSANTDGVVTLCPVELLSVRDAIIKQWEDRTSISMEKTGYKAIYSADVNNYVAVKADGGVKSKGFFSDAGYNPSSWRGDNLRVCVEAVKNYLTTGKPLADTIAEETDMFKFVAFKRVKRGCYVDRTNRWVGKVARYYYVKDGDTLLVNNTVSKVPDAQGIALAMDMREVRRELVDEERYLKIAQERLCSITGEHPLNHDIFYLFN